MSETFTKFIAQRLFNYFTSGGTQILVGERFLLTLDNQDTVKGVYESLKSIAEAAGACQKFCYESYQTYSITIPGTKLVVAAKFDSRMTDDFLTTLRNADLGNKYYPILILVESTIDSISSGTRNLAGPGMPFDHKAIRKYIDNEMKDYKSNPLQEATLKKAYETLEKDRFMDQNSLKEYEPLLTVFEQGKINDEDYESLGFFPFGNSVEKQHIKNEVNDNSRYFDQLQKLYSRSDFERIKDLFGKNISKKMEDNRFSNVPWYTSLTYENVKKGYDRAQEVSDKDSEIRLETIQVINPNDHNLMLEYDLKESKKKKYNLFIFNPDKIEQVELYFETTKKVTGWDICPNKSPELETNKKKVTWRLNASGCSIYSIKPSGSRSSLLKICILNLPRSFLDAQNQSYDISAKKRDKSSLINVDIYGYSFELNEHGIHQESIDFESSANPITMTIKDRLKVYFSESYLMENRPKLSVTIGEINIPFSIKAQNQTIKELDGKGILLKKLVEKKSFTVSGTSFIMGSEKFRVKAQTNFRYSLDLEKSILDQKLIIAEFENDIRSILKPSSLEDTVDSNIKLAYLKVLSCFQKEQTLPSLSYYSGELQKVIESFLSLYKDALFNIQDNNTLTEQENALLYIGAILDPFNNRVLFSPLSPLNLLYQTELQKNICGTLESRFAEMLTPQNLIPYLKAPIPSVDNSRSYAITEQDHSPEWRIYSERGVTEALISRSYVKTIVKNKIKQYRNHFPFLFESPSSLTMNINVIHMGNCEEVFDGIIDYYTDNLKSDSDPDNYIQFCINIYKSNLMMETAFDRLMDLQKLEKYLGEHVSDKKVELTELVSILSRKIRIFNFEYNNTKKSDFKYAHLSFIEMKSNPMTGTQDMYTMPTGMAVGGLISGVSSSMKSDNVWYNSGFGMEYALDTEFSKTVARLNAVSSVAFTGSDFSSNICLNTQINAKQDVLLKNLYESSNWVVFINPKVDLSFFKNPGINEDLMIIHYSDQLSPASGYDDITVTAKVQQYEARIREYLQSSGSDSNKSKIGNIIQLFNAVNGDWLLKMNSENFTDTRSYFSKEKMSILSAVRMLLLYTADSKTIWVPMSLEEILRVSGNVGLSQKDGRLSAKNLGFENQQPKCDDILLVGIRSDSVDEPLKVAFHPVEVKIGLNDSGTISKAKAQTINTLNGLKEAIFPENSDTLAAKLLQCFFLQQVLLASEKIKAFDIYPDTNWTQLTEDWRKRLLNNEVVYSSDLNGSMADTTVISFKDHAGIGSLKRETEDDNSVDILTLPSDVGVRYLTDDYSQIRKELCQWGLMLKSEAKFSKPDTASENLESEKPDENSSDNSEKHQEKSETETLQTKVPAESSDEDQNDTDSASETIPDTEVENFKDEDNPSPVDDKYMEILFGTSDTSGKPVYWEPNNSEIVVNLNTGVIGTSGTGKTQFVKSLIAQLEMQKNRNFDNKDFGILIFDYKGDYNQTKKDFYDLLHPQILTLEDLPVNPFSLEGAKSGQSRIPMHRARGFVDTISKAYNLGKVQQKNLKNAIIDAYHSRGIDVQDSSTWDKLPPTLNDVYRAYIENDEIKKGDSLEAALEELDDFGIFESNPAKAKSLYNLVKGVVVVDLTTSDSNSIRNLVVAVMLDQFYQQMLSGGSSQINGKYRELSKFILVDEADNFMSQGFESLKKILKEGREFGVGLILSTQYLNHFDYGDDNYAKYINTWIIHEFKGGKPAEMDIVFGNAKPEARQQRLEQISKLQKFHSIVKIGTGPIQTIRDYSFYLLLQDINSSKNQ